MRPRHQQTCWSLVLRMLSPKNLFLLSLFVTAQTMQNTATAQPIVPLTLPKDDRGLTADYNDAIQASPDCLLGVLNGRDGTLSVTQYCGESLKDRLGTSTIQQIRNSRVLGQTLIKGVVTLTTELPDRSLQVDKTDFNVPSTAQKGSFYSWTTFFQPQAHKQATPPVPAPETPKGKKPQVTLFINNEYVGSGEAVTRVDERCGTVSCTAK